MLTEEEEEAQSTSEAEEQEHEAAEMAVEQSCILHRLSSLLGGLLPVSHFFPQTPMFISVGY